MDRSLEKILGIIVIYNKSLDNSETLNSLGKDLETMGLEMDLFVYDNSSQKQVNYKINGFNILKHFHNGINVGVSAAYNEGVKFAQNKNKEWALLLDQDTLFRKGAIDEYLNNIKSYEYINLFSPIIKLENGSIFSPFKKVFKRGIVLREVEAKKYPLKKYSPVNSGILVKISSFLEAGGYNEKVKLDFSDIEFIRRFNKCNKDFKIINTICIQDFSNDETNVTNLNVRFGFFCDGIKNCERNNLYEDFQFFIIVLIRMGMLILRTKKIIFIKTFWRCYLN